MKNKKYGFIYITTNKINGKKYIGQKKYNKNWTTYLGSGIVLKNAINKYGIENFEREIIEECDSKKELDDREIYWIKFYDAVNSDIFYNIACGGDGGNTLAGYDEQQLLLHSEILSKALKGNINQGCKNPMAKQVICLNDMKIFNTTIEAGLEYGIKDYSVQSACNIKSKAKSGGIHPLTGEKLLFEYYDKTKVYEYIPYKRDKTSISTKVMCINTNEIFDSIKDASEKYNISTTKISHNCNHYCKCGGYGDDGSPYYWIKYDEYLKYGINENYYQRDKIQQYDIDGNLLNVYRTYEEASKITGINKARIKRNVDGVTKYIDGFVFKERLYI